MSHSSSPAILALLGLRLKGFATSEQVATLVGLSEAAVEAVLQEASASNQAVFRDGRRTGWTLKPGGRAEIERLLSDELDEAGCRQLAQSAYDRFLALNGTMLQVCTNWQVKDTDTQILNDHEDPAYDELVIADLGKLDEAVQPICAELADELDRFSIYSRRFSSSYSRRFSSSLAKVQSGERAWFAAPIKESYHTVWFELHEDLLATLGIDRATEKAH